MTMGGRAVRAFGPIGIRLADEAYMSWRAAQIACHQALEAWLAADVCDRAAANCAYRAALDREEAAARDFERLTELRSAA
ncbi:MAG: hypothetical protein JWO02_944 [Solirubrobacterales bacterium]|nr:hypothetical protein [Solirubrobacterales bacterium]